MKKISNLIILIIMQFRRKFNCTFMVKTATNICSSVRF